MTTIRVSSSVDLEGRWDLPSVPNLGVVLCHPHPLLGGSMAAPLLQAITEHLVDRGVAVLRFNFRGVGRSDGTHDHGLSEIDDVAAAVDHAHQRLPELSFGIGGWSFGAGVALRWHARDRYDLNYVGLATAMGPLTNLRLPEPESLHPAPRTFIVGNRDQIVPPSLLVDYAERAGATLHVMEGADHYFHLRDRQLACLVEAGLGLPVPADQIEAACR